MIAQQTWADFDREGTRDPEFMRFILAWQQSWPKAPGPVYRGSRVRIRLASLRSSSTRTTNLWKLAPSHPRGYWRLALEMHQEPVRHRVTGGGFVSWH